MGCTRPACSNACFSGALKSPTGTSARRPAPETQPGTFRSNSATSVGVELPQSGWFAKSTSIPTGMYSFTWSSRNFFRLVASSFRSSILRQSASSPENLTVNFPSSAPVSVNFKSAFRSTRESELGGSVVVTQLPPSLSSRNPMTPVSGHDSNPNGANAVAGSQYTSFPFNFTSTTSPSNSNAFIICGLKKYSLRAEMYTEYASNPAAFANARNNQLIWRPS